MTTQPFIDLEREDKPSASSMHRIWACSGSENLINSIPVEQRVKTDDAVTASGTRVHAALAGDDEELDVTEDEIKQRLAELEAEVVGQWRIDVLLQKIHGDLPEMQIIREERFWILDDNGKNIASAKPDVVYCCGTCALVINYKAAFKPVPKAQSNHQCRTEALAVWSEFYFTNIRVAICQHRLKSAVTQADYDDESLYEAAAQLKFTLWRAAQPDSPRTAGPHCDWCPAKAHCPELTTYALLPSVTMLPPSPIDLPAKAQKEYVALAVAQLTVEQLAFIERRRGIASKLFDAVKDRMKALTSEQLASVGYELADGRNQLEVKDFTGLTEAMYQMMDRKELTAEEFAGAFEFYIGAVEKAVLPRRIAKTEALMLPKLTAKAAKEGLRQELSTFIDFNGCKSAPILKEL